MWLGVEICKNNGHPTSTASAHEGKGVPHISRRMPSLFVRIPSDMCMTRDGGPCARPLLAGKEAWKCVGKLLQRGRPHAELVTFLSVQAQTSVSELSWHLFCRICYALSMYVQRELESPCGRGTSWRCGRRQLYIGVAPVWRMIR